MGRITWMNESCSGSSLNIYDPIINFFGLRTGRVYLFCLVLLISLISPGFLHAKEIDYQSLQEDPLETAYRKLASPGDIEWDEEEMVSGGAPLIISEMRWPLDSGELSGLFSRTASKGRRKHLGLDIVAPKGTPIYAALDGIVEVVSNGGKGFRGYGRHNQPPDQLDTLCPLCDDWCKGRPESETGRTDRNGGQDRKGHHQPPPF